MHVASVSPAPRSCQAISASAGWLRMTNSTPPPDAGTNGRYPSSSGGCFADTKKKIQPIALGSALHQNRTSAMPPHRQQPTSPPRNSRCHAFPGRGIHSGFLLSESTSRRPFGMFAILIESITSKHLLFQLLQHEILPIINQARGE